jgi:hypothetical protein
VKSVKYHKLARWRELAIPGEQHKTKPPIIEAKNRPDMRPPSKEN